MNSFPRAGLAASLPAPEWLTNPEGLRLAFNTYPAARPWLHLVISHGFGEHRGWWQHVAQSLPERGITAHVFDHFHHGLSDGEPADAPDYEVLSNGLLLALRQGVVPRLAGQPLVWLAHSNGALIALRALERLSGAPLSRARAPGDRRAGDRSTRGQPDGDHSTGRPHAVVLSSPFVGLLPMTRIWGTPLATLLSMYNPHTFWPLKPNPPQLTGDSALWDDYLRDPLRFRKISVRFFLAMVRQTGAVQHAPSCQGLPLLLLRAGLEQIVNPQAITSWYDRVASPDKLQRVYPELHHELFNEQAWPRVLDDMVGWLKARWERS